MECSQPADLEDNSTAAGIARVASFQNQGGHCAASQYDPQNVHLQFHHSPLFVRQFLECDTALTIYPIP